MEQGKKRFIQSLCRNKSLVNTKTDRLSGVVILDYQNSVNKMMKIHKDMSGYIHLVSTDKFDSILTIDAKFSKTSGQVV